MAGVLCALLEKGKTFEVFHTSGAGALMVLLSLAPKGRDPTRALRQWVDAGVSDAIYKYLPFNFKLFHKPGPFAPVFHRAAQRFKVPVAGGAPPLPGDGGTPKALYRAWIDLWVDPKRPSRRRLYNDWVELVFSLLTPSTLTYRSMGMAARVPFLEDLIDFERLRNFRGHFCVNAYNMTDRVMELFDKSVIDGDHIRAAFSFPFIYPPTRLNGKYYTEGADIDPINFHDLLPAKQGESIQPIVLMDIMGGLEPYLVRAPRNLWDAYVISIMTPIVALAQKNVDRFETSQAVDPTTGRRPYELIKIEFDIPVDRQPFIMDWSYSNLSALFSVGYKAGEKFFEQYGHRLVDYADWVTH